MLNFDFIKFALQLYWNHTSAWVFPCKFAPTASQSSISLVFPYLRLIFEFRRKMNQEIYLGNCTQRIIQIMKKWVFCKSKLEVKSIFRSTKFCLSPDFFRGFPQSGNNNSNGFWLCHFSSILRTAYRNLKSVFFKCLHGSVFLYLFSIKTPYASFSWIWYNCLKTLEPLGRDSLLLTSMLPGVLGTQLLNLRCMKGWTANGVTK